jgi:hypothetical protein
MRSKTNKNLRAVLPAVAAAGLSAWLGAPAAHASFNLAWTSAGLTNGGADTVWVLTAQNDGLSGPQQQPQGFTTGTGIVAMDLILSTPGSGTSGALVMDVVTKSGKGASTTYDVDGLDPNGGYFGGTLPSEDPGTFISFGSGPYTGPGQEFANGTTPINGGAAVYVNSQTYANFTQPAVGGGITSAQGTAANYSTTQGTIDPAFTSNTVHSLELILQATVTDTLATPIANLVIPTGTVGTAIALLTPTANPSNTETYTISTVPPILTSTLAISLTSASGNTPAAAPITLTGSNGGYQPVEIAVASGAQTTGELTVTNFNPASDQEIYVLEANSDGTPLTSAQLTQIITDLQGALALGGPADGSVGLYSSLPASIQALFHGTYNLELTFPTGNSPTLGTNPDVLAYDFSGYTTIPNVTISAIGVVPEPTGVGVLVLGGIGLMARRRRMNRASA